MLYRTYVSHIHVTEGLVKRLGLLGSMCQATTLYQVMTRT